MNISAGKNSIIGDEPAAKGGQEKDLIHQNFQLRLFHHATTATIKMFADRKEWDVEEVSVKVLFDNETKEGVSQFKKIIEIKGNLTEEQRNILHKTAHACPIQKILTGEIAIESELLP